MAVLISLFLSRPTRVILFFFFFPKWWESEKKSIFFLPHCVLYNRLSSGLPSPRPPSSTMAWTTPSIASSRCPTDEVRTWRLWDDWLEGWSDWRRCVRCVLSLFCAEISAMSPCFLDVGRRAIDRHLVPPPRTEPSGVSPPPAGKVQTLCQTAI